MGTVTAPTSLTAEDRCDGCGAQAYVRTTHDHDGKSTDLLWCSHHWRNHGDKLSQSVVLDERFKLA